VWAGECDKFAFETPIQIPIFNLNDERDEGGEAGEREAGRKKE
jgi:hypothetical protein